jgi:hypothetical protein
MSAVRFRLLAPLSDSTERGYQLIACLRGHMAEGKQSPQFPDVVARLKQFARAITA